jgi:hypothetical protein
MAVESADVVILRDDIGAIPGLVALSKRCRLRIRQNIALAVSIKILFVVLALTSVLAKLWVAVLVDAISVLLVSRSGRVCLLCHTHTRTYTHTHTHAHARTHALACLTTPAFVLVIARASFSACVLHVGRFPCQIALFSRFDTISLRHDCRCSPTADVAWACSQAPVVALVWMTTMAKL